jgi:5-methylcytosine-specific restriction endonuclease McrA
MARRIVRLRADRMGDQAGHCYYCRQPMWQGDDPSAFCSRHGVTPKRAVHFRCTAEHLMPLSEGGGTKRENIVAACRFCNVTRHRAKRPKDPAAYLAHVQNRLARGRWLRLPSRVPSAGARV